MAIGTVDPAKLERAKAVVNQMAATQREKQPEALVRLEARADRFNRQTWLHLGASSLVAAPTVVAGLQSGAIKRYVMVSRDRAGSVQFYMGHALAELAREKGAEVVFLDRVDALLVEKKREEIPAEVLEVVSGHQVSLIESIAFGQPLPRPGTETLNVVDLKKNGTLKREIVGAATPEQAQTAKNNMGLNPGKWHELLVKLGLMDVASVDVSYSSWVDMPTYGILAEAKRTLENEAVERRARKENGCSYVVMQPATISPALTMIKKGLSMGLESVYGSRRQGDDLTFAEKGLLTLLAIADPTFSHPWMDRERGGALLRFDRSERESFPKTEIKLSALENEIPLESIEVVAAPQADAILRRVFGWPEGWQRELDPIRILEQIEA